MATTLDFYLRKSTIPEIAVGGKGMLMSFQDALRDATGGRPYVMVIMGYEDEKTRAPSRLGLFDLIKDVVEREFDMACIRADHVSLAGLELLGKLHSLIERSELVIAEISEKRPNVFYELGYARGVGMAPILMVEKGRDIPYDLRGLETLEYVDSIDGINELRKNIAAELGAHLKPETNHLRQMLAPGLPNPSYIVASPKRPGEKSRIHEGVFDSRTYGDHLGILGVIAAFGVLYGGRGIGSIELISADNADPNLLKEKFNLFMIGSHKANLPVKTLLSAMVDGRSPQWIFAHEDGIGIPEVGDWPVALYRGDSTGFHKLPAGRRPARPASSAAEPPDVWDYDYGLVVRGPHPGDPTRLAVIMAGPHSLGTGAACLAATRPSLIKMIDDQLPGGVLTDKSKTVWALVKGNASKNDNLIDESGVEVIEAGYYR